jgi:hypothetical protein
MEPASPMIRRAAAAALLAVLAARSAASACEGRPVRVPVLGAADMGVLPEACEATEISLENRGAVLVATDDLYGSVQAGFGLRGRLIVAERTWLSLWAPGFEYRFVANATVEADRASLGGSVLGAHHRIPLGARTSLAPFARILLPTETGFERATRWGFEDGVAVTTQIHERIEIVGGYAMTLTSTVNGGRTLSVLTHTFATDAVWRPGRVFGLAAGVGSRFVLADPRPLESLDPRLAFRFYPGRGFFVFLGGMLPLFGRDRTNVAAALSIGWTAL